MERHQEWNMGCCDLQRWWYKVECPQTKTAQVSSENDNQLRTLANAPHTEGWFLPVMGSSQPPILMWPSFFLDSSLGVNPFLMQAMCPLHSNTGPAIVFPTKRLEGLFQVYHFPWKKGALPSTPRTVLPVGSGYNTDPRHPTSQMRQWILRTKCGTGSHRMRELTPASYLLTFTWAPWQFSLYPIYNKKKEQMG